MGHAVWKYAKFSRRRAQQGRAARLLYQLRWRRFQPIGVAIRLIIDARWDAGETSETKATTVVRPIARRQFV